jgi:hypothetical protein
MEIEIKPFSPKAAELQTKNEKSATKGLAYNPIYPFDKLEVGQCFTVPISANKEASLQVIASRKSKKGRTFRMIKHENLGIIEVARIA